MSIKILGIDPGSLKTGFGMIELKNNSTLEYAVCGTIQTKNDDLSIRLCDIFEKLNSVLNDQNPDVMAIESIFYARNVRSSIVLSHARGIALLSAGKHKIPIEEYSPAEIKESITGNGRANKESVKNMVKLVLKLKEDISYDSSDALAVAICHAHSIPFKKALKKYDDI